MRQEVENILMGILRNDFSVRRAFSAQSLICHEIGICDGEFQDFMSLIERRCGLKLPSPCLLPFREDEATVEIISNWIVLQHDN